MAQPCEGDLDHTIYFTSRKISNAEKSYTKNEWEALTVVYLLQKFRNYLLGGPFKFFIDHSTFKYLVKKPVLEGKICIWLLFF